VRGDHEVFFIHVSPFSFEYTKRQDVLKPRTSFVFPQHPVTSRHRDAAWELITDCYNPTLILIQRRGKSCARFFKQFQRKQIAALKRARRFVILPIFFLTTFIEPTLIHFHAILFRLLKISLSNVHIVFNSTAIQIAFGQIKICPTSRST